jgi:hypothetical protein
MLRTLRDAADYIVKLAEKADQAATEWQTAFGQSFVGDSSRINLLRRHQA